MTSSDIRKSFLDFFKSKQHTIVPSSSLMPDSPNLLFTNSGMNQFVPIFLGQVKCPYNPARAADTQKCIRAGGKHNDLDDVGLDTYHHTFFEMLGNWSFGDYFKKEAIDWAWELITEVWRFPKNRLYATVYSPDKAKGDPSEFDQEAYDFWAAKFIAAGLDPKIHIVYGNKKDNFWMMGETGPCGPCSELHVDLTPDGSTKGSLVNKGSPQCIEIWNLVFIQFNANPDGTFSPLPARHVDTGMGFERVTSIIQCTKNFTDFKGIISNYETDIFRPIFDRLEKMSGKKYGSTLPGASHSGEHTRPRVSPTAPSQSALSSSGTIETKYSRRNLPHFERPWAKYMVTYSTANRRELTPTERDLAMRSILYAHEQRQYQLYAACVMPDHVHLLFEPQIKKQDETGNPIFWSLSEILQGVKSASAHKINEASNAKGTVWEKESLDRIIRGQSDLEEKFHYITRNPWDAGVVSTQENYRWTWVPDGGDWTSGSADALAESTAGARLTAREGACAPRETTAPTAEQLQIDVAFRVIADHIRTLSFAIADGIQPGNTDRNYVLRRILRRAVRYGRSLGFHGPFFYKLVDVLAETMGDVFPEIRARQQIVRDVLQTEEEAFNKTLDRGIELFNEEVSKLTGGTGNDPMVGGHSVAMGGTGYQPVVAANLAATGGATYSKRNLPHFEKPWAIYAVDFRTFQSRTLSPIARDIIFDCILHWKNIRYRLVAACVMPDHVHFIIQPGVKEEDTEGKPVFWPLSEILHSIKSFSANEINKAEGVSGSVWQEERYDRYIRSDRDLEEKFQYVCRNPWDAGAAGQNQPWPWLWTEDIEANQPYKQPPGLHIKFVGRVVGPLQIIKPVGGLPTVKSAGQVARQDGLVARSTQDGRSNQISGAFAFRLYDEQGFPLDLTELMARERGLTVDTAGFEKLMEEQRARARAAQKKTVIELSRVDHTLATTFVGYDVLVVNAKTKAVVGIPEKPLTRKSVVTDISPFYAEMGGQIGDSGIIRNGNRKWHVINTLRADKAFCHVLSDTDQGQDELNTIDTEVELVVDSARRNAIQRHHTVTHLLHWALHEVVSKEAAQKGSFVGPDKLTFDFNSAPLTPSQVSDVEKLVNERILENAGVSWTEVPHAEVKQRKDVMQFFGDKYGDIVRVVQIGGDARKLNGYSMELCGGTHTRATGEIGLFRIMSEAAVAAGVRRIEAVAGLAAYQAARAEAELVRSLAGKVSAPIGELEKKIESLLAQQRELEKSLRAASQKEAAGKAKELLARAQSGRDGMRVIVENLGAADGDYLQAVADALKGEFKGVVVLGGATGGAVSLVATVSADFTSKVQAGKIIQAIAPIVGGKGGGKPDNARGGGKDVGKLNEALAKAKELLR